VLGLLPFATTYMCEMRFSTYVSTKTKYRKRHDDEPNNIQSIKPNIRNICKNKKQISLIPLKCILSLIKVLYIHIQLLLFLFLF
jgi:hypothetical protein